MPSLVSLSLYNSEQEDGKVDYIDNAVGAFCSKVVTLLTPTDGANTMLVPSAFHEPIFPCLNAFSYYTPTTSSSFYEFLFQFANAMWHHRVKQAQAESASPKMSLRFPRDAGREIQESINTAMVQGLHIACDLYSFSQLCSDDLL